MSVEDLAVGLDIQIEIFDDRLNDDIALRNPGEISAAGQPGVGS